MNGQQVWINTWFIKSKRWFVLTYESPKLYAQPWSICTWNEIYYFSFRFTQKALGDVYLTWYSLSFFPYRILPLFPFRKLHRFFPKFFFPTFPAFFKALRNLREVNIFGIRQNSTSWLISQFSNFVNN